MENKKKLGILLLIVSVLLLITGSFAWTSFTQRAINDRKTRVNFEEVGRLHDYFDRATGNKDVFAENFGDAPILVRVKLLEYMEINGESLVQADPAEVAAGNAVQPIKEDTGTWTAWTPEASGNSVGNRVGPGAVFNARAHWTVGWQPRAATEGSGQLNAPYFMPTFNRDRNDHKTAAAGHGRDWTQSGEEADTSASPDGTNAGADATGVTHPGDGTDGFWNSGDTANSLLGTPPDTESGPHTARQTVIQDQPVMLLSQWNALPVSQRVGNFWVVDPQTGWAYWANMLFPEEATSFLLDKANLSVSGLRGELYYGIKAVANMVANTDADVNAFWDGGNENPSDLAKQLVDEVRTGLPILGEMTPGQTFSMRGTQYRYLEDKGEGNHLVMMNSALSPGQWGTLGTTSYNGSIIDNRMRDFHDNLPSVMRRQVQPVQTNFPDDFANQPTGWGNFGAGGEVSLGSSQNPAALWVGGTNGWLFNMNHASVPASMREDLTAYTPGGERKAFALSLADLMQVSGDGRAFPTRPSRASQGPTEHWPLRTFGRPNVAWYIDASINPSVGAVVSHLLPVAQIDSPGYNPRPALIMRDQGGVWTSGL
ncbi:hypothetical protein [Lactococcus garvieae]|uniref:Uncharacterized protein n=1 Tax=Lactococcus garvieae DCC43 TaxID=1231377 RepID=K2QFG8_9LACT|nr:hypothetical protein [Lactococcus garvieae]EKF52212.1 hypothetical protein C426_0485 [Lactococcus garvieae DCC43]